MTAEAMRRWRGRNPEKVRAATRLRSTQLTARQTQMRARLSAIKLERGCVDCGYRASAVALQFDHVRGQKSFNVSQCASRSWEQIEAEMSKCEVRCANCHAVRTWGL